MAHPPEPVRQPKKRFKLQVRYKGSEPDDVVYFSSEIQKVEINESQTFLARNENEVFACPFDKIFSFSVTQE